MSKYINYEEAMIEFKKGNLVRSEYMAQMSYITNYTEITDEMKNGKWMVRYN